MNEHPGWSRRAVLRTAAMLTGTLLASTVVPNRAAYAQQKASKAAMKYQDQANGDKQCGNCMHFVPRRAARSSRERSVRKATASPGQKDHKPRRPELE
jgi:hypothetical protein